ncbi:MAG: xylulokinase, partial [Spirochaetales bacterium]|nr:xylulokinase [Spirochaetales bacterium]
NYTQANIARSSMEASIFGLLTGLESFRELGFNPREIRLIGGGANSPFWSQMTADILECTVRIPTGKEAAAVGAALQALWMLGQARDEKVTIAQLASEHITLDEERVYEPNPETVPAYRETYKVYQSYVKALSGLFS